MKSDFADKSWLRPEKQPPPPSWSVILGLWLMFLGLLLIGSVCQAQGARTVLVLLETSSQPATLDECQRARPDLPRPNASISRQDRTGEPWHHRSCWWRQG